MFRLVLKSLPLFLLVLSHVFTTYAQEAVSSNLLEYTVTADTANVRSGAGTNFSVVGSVARGDTLLIYQEQETEGWLRIYQFEGGQDAYIADFLVERAPVRFYPPTLQPVIEIEGRGRDISDVIDLPRGAYRVDASIQDNAFILKFTVLEGDCRDSTIFNEFNRNVSQMEISGLLVSTGCSLIFETDNVDGNWSIAIRDILDSSLIESALRVETGTSIAGIGRALTMPTFLRGGIWSISATVNDQAFILKARPLGDCDEKSVFNELDFDAEMLEAAALYRVPADGCVVFWETENVEGSWELIFENIR